MDTNNITFLIDKIRQNFVDLYNNDLSRDEVVFILNKTTSDVIELYKMIKGVEPSLDVVDDISLDIFALLKYLEEHCCNNDEFTTHVLNSLVARCFYIRDNYLLMNKD